MMHPEIVRANRCFTELYRFADELVHLGHSADANRFAGFGDKIGFVLPEDFVYMLARHNSFSLTATEVYGLDPAFGGASLDQVYHTEHFEVDHPMPPELLPFSPDGAGNHYCLDLSRRENGICPVIFWQHDYQYDESDRPEVTHSSFAHWVEDWMIELRLEDMNYDGSEKKSC